MYVRNSLKYFQKKRARNGKNVLVPYLLLSFDEEKKKSWRKRRHNDQQNF